MVQMQRRAMSRPLTSLQPQTVAIIGAGLAGTACANAFAHKGCGVTVYEQATTPAAGASGVPVAMFAPSVSADDAPHSRLLRQGVHLLLAELERLSQQGLLTRGQDWALTGVLERCIRADKKLPSTWLAPQDAPDLQSRMLGKPYSVRPTKLCHSEIWHGMGGWVNPRRLIDAWLAHPNITLKTNHTIDDVTKLASDVVVVAAGYQSATTLPALHGRLQTIRGQVEWATGPIDLPFKHPINGFGHCIQTADRWLVGATFQRDESDVAPRAKDVALNFEKLATLMPELAKSELAKLQKQATSWVGIRAAQKNRAPLVERITGLGHPQVWACTGLGSRGLSLAALCASRLLTSIENSLALG
jgi:tRNA 5-methylaminomethyl-2-thiouridine biosynthesis bifunctional protein